jgi:hypothetical protein
MNVVVGRAADGDLPRPPELFAGRRQRPARRARHRLEVADLLLDSRVDADDAPRLVRVHRGSLAHVPDDGGDRPTVVGSDVQRVRHVVRGRRSRDLRRKPVATGQQVGQPRCNPPRDLVLVVGAPDHAAHVVDEGLEGVRFHVGAVDDAAHFTIRYLRCVTPGASTARICSSCTGASARSPKMRAPSPSNSGTTWSSSSSSSPAARYC